MTREQGFYWVVEKLDDARPEVGEYKPTGYWYLNGCRYDERELIVLSERLIPPEEA